MSKILFEYDDRNRSLKNRKVRNYIKALNDIYPDELLLKWLDKLENVTDEKLIHTRKFLDSILSIYFSTNVKELKRIGKIRINPDDIIYSFLIGSGILKYRIVMDHLDIMHKNLSIFDIDKVFSVIDNIFIPFETLCSTIYRDTIVWNGMSDDRTTWSFDIISSEGRRTYFAIPSDIHNSLMDAYNLEFFSEEKFDDVHEEVGNTPGCEEQMYLYYTIGELMPNRLMKLINLERDMIFNLRTFRKEDGKLCRIVPVLNTEDNSLNIAISYYDNIEDTWYSKGIFFEYVKEEFSYKDLFNIYIGLIFELVMIVDNPNFNIKLNPNNI